MSRAQDVVINLLAFADVRINGARPWDIQVHDQRFFGRVLAFGTLGFGESGDLGKFGMGLVTASRCIYRHFIANWTMRITVSFGDLHNDDWEIRVKFFEAENQCLLA